MVKSKKKKLKESKKRANIKNIKYWMWRKSLCESHYLENYGYENFCQSLPTEKFLDWENTIWWNRPDDDVPSEYNVCLDCAQCLSEAPDIIR